MWDLDRVFKVTGIVASTVSIVVGGLVIAEKLMGKPVNQTAGAGDTAQAKAA